MARQNTEDSGRTKVDDGASEKIISQDLIDWPGGCLFFDPYTMDANQLRRLLWQNSAYVGDKKLATIPKQITCISLPDTGSCSTGQLTYNPSSKDLSRWLSDTEMATKIAYIGAKRNYLSNSSHNMIGLPLHEGQQVRHSLQILPGALELLHDNNEASLT